MEGEERKQNQEKREKEKLILGAGSKKAQQTQQGMLKLSGPSELS